MVTMSPNDYKEWLEKQSLSTIEFERARILSLMHRSESDSLLYPERCPVTPSKDAYINAGRLLEVLGEVLAEKRKEQDKQEQEI